LWRKNSDAISRETLKKHKFFNTFCAVKQERKTLFNKKISLLKRLLTEREVSGRVIKIVSNSPNSSKLLNFHLKEEIFDENGNFVSSKSICAHDAVVEGER
jgi:hypothetical protein